MKRVLLTGMSGTGKSTVIRALSDRGYRAVDTDDDRYSGMMSVPGDGVTGVRHGRDWVWREDQIRHLLSEEGPGILFVAGCSPNQGMFYPHFDLIVLLAAPAPVIVERLASRTSNPFGKRPEEVERVLHLQREIEPLLRAGAGLEIDTSAPLADVVANLLGHLGEPV